jgi:hypothetical protein
VTSLAFRPFLRLQHPAGVRSASQPASKHRDPDQLAVGGYGYRWIRLC